MKIRPLGDRVLVQPKKDVEVSRGGIYIPDNAKEKPQEGKVFAVGAKALSVKPGDRVLLPKYGGSEVRVEDVTYLLVKEEDILGILD
jgi:chaperonin GroES